MDGSKARSHSTGRQHGLLWTASHMSCQCNDRNSCRAAVACHGHTEDFIRHIVPALLEVAAAESCKSLPGTTVIAQT